MRQPKGFIPIIVVVFIAILASTMVGVSWWYSEKSEEIKKLEPKKQDIKTEQLQKTKKPAEEKKEKPKEKVPTAAELAEKAKK